MSCSSTPYPYKMNAPLIFPNWKQFAKSHNIFHFCFIENNLVYLLNHQYLFLSLYFLMAIGKYNHFWNTKMHRLSSNILKLFLEKVLIFLNLLLIFFHSVLRECEGYHQKLAQEYIRLSGLLLSHFLHEWLHCHLHLLADLSSLSLNKHTHVNNQIGSPVCSKVEVVLCYPKVRKNNDCQFLHEFQHALLHILYNQTNICFLRIF